LEEDVVCSLGVGERVKQKIGVKEVGQLSADNMNCIPEEGTFYDHHCESLKSYIVHL
jgi:hypothetical protein